MKFIFSVFASLNVLAVQIACAEAVSLGQIAVQYADRLPVIYYSAPNKTYGIYSVTDPNFMKAKLGLAPDQDTLDNGQIRVVEQTSNQVVSLHDFEGRNVMYHLIQARDYFAHLDPQAADSIQPLTVRLRMTCSYSPFSHFMCGKKEARYNDDGFMPSDFQSPKRWGAEIWFHKRKTEVQWLPLAIQVGTSALSSPIYGPLTALPFALYQNVNTGMNGALIPNVIYHEASHWMLHSSGVFPTRYRPHPIGENVADYFAAAVGGDAKIAGLSEYADPKIARNLESSGVFSISRLMSLKFTADKKALLIKLLPSVLWDIRNEILEPFFADQIVYKAMNRLELKNGYRDFARTYMETLKTEASRLNQALPEETLTKIENLWQKNAKRFSTLDGVIKLYMQSTFAMEKHKLPRE